MKTSLFCGWPVENECDTCVMRVTWHYWSPLVYLHFVPGLQWMVYIFFCIFFPLSYPYTWDLLEY